MGVLLDSTFLIISERRGLTAEDAIQEAARISLTRDLGISVVSVMEMAHGESRADSSRRASSRERFLSRLLLTIDVYPVTREIARRAGRLDGALARVGENLAFPDILIGVTALELGYSILTNNMRHFNRIPGLAVLHHGAL